MKPVKSLHNWTKSKKNLKKKAVFYLHFLSSVKSIPFEPVLNGWVQKMRAEVGKKGKGKRREKQRKKEEKMGFKFFIFFYKSTRRFFHMRSGHFSNI